jgi:hypothetical protein
MIFILNPKGQLLTRYSHLSLQFHPPQHRHPYKQETGVGKVKIKIGAGIDNNGTKKAGKGVPAEEGIQGEMTEKGIPKTGIERNRAS